MVALSHSLHGSRLFVFLFPFLVACFSYHLPISLDMFCCCGFLYCVPVTVFMNDGSSADVMYLKGIVAFCRSSLVVGFMKTIDFTAINSST